MTRLRILTVSAGLSLCLAAGRCAEPVSLTAAELLAKGRISGEVVVDAGRDRTGDGTGSLAVQPGASWSLPLRAADGFGSVALWVYDDGSVPADPKAHGAGPLWGVEQVSGPVLVVGPVYAPYLSGDRHYAASDWDAAGDGRPWWQVQHLGIPREARWHHWEFVFEAEGGLRILHDGKDINADRPVFNWNRTRLRGIAGVTIVGDKTDSGQTVWADDATVGLEGEGIVDPVWPPPPPEDLVLQPGAPMAPEAARWRRGPNRDPDVFPIAVWLQDPVNASRYKAAGINLYIGLWKGPTEEQLETLRAAGMPVICSQNATALKHVDDDIIAGWMHGDEPDNAQALPDGGGYGPPVPAERIVEDYTAIAARDSSRPVLLNLGQGVAWDGWYGRGVRTNHPEDYLEYVKGCDIVSFDIYPAVHDRDAIKGNLWYVGYGVSRLREWSRDERVVWNCIEASRISDTTTKPTPHQVKAEVWMSIIHGSRGLIYFVHQFKPTFNEHALLDDAELLEAVTALNGRVQSLARIINGPPIEGAVTATSNSPLTPIHWTVRRDGPDWLVFAVAMYQRETEARFRIAGLGDATVEVIDEDRSIAVTDGAFSDGFDGYGVHLYRIRPR